MADAGWYPDPQNPNSEAFFDGRAWTEQRRPAASPPAPASVDEQPTQQWSAPEPTQQWQAPPAAPGWQAPPAAPPAWQAPPQGAPDHAAGAAWQPAAAQPGWPQPGADWQTQQWQPAPAPRRARRTPLVLGAVAALVVAGGVVTWLAWPGDDAPSLTYQGKPIAAPGAVLTKAEARIDGLIRSRHGAGNESTRCYFVQPTTPAAGQKKTDVQDALRCGPVLFVDGDTSKPYLSVPVDDSPAGSSVTLTPRSPSSTAQPGSGGTVRLVRPDGKDAPEGSGGLTVPAPPAAGKDVLTAATLGPTAPPRSLSGAKVVGKDAGFTVEAAGRIDRYGSGDDARSAPAGQQLLAFQLSYGEGDVGSAGSTRAQLVVDGGTPRDVPETTGGDEWVIAAVPASSKAELRFTEGGYTQTLSLPDGTPGAGNLKVLARSHRTAYVGKRADVPIGVSNGSGSGSVTFRADFQFASLDYWVPGHEDKHARDAGSAILTLKLNYTDSEDPGKTFGFDPSLLRLRLPDGRVLRARNVADPGRILDVFDVPADFTSGTLQFTGSERVQGIDVRVRRTVSIPFAIPAG